MTSLKDYAPGPPKVLLLGPPGSGKTVLACTVGPYGTVLDLNRGLSSAQRLQDKLTALRLEVEVECLWEGVELPAVWGRVESLVQTLTTTPRRPVLVVDGLSDLAECSLARTLFDQKKWGGASPPVVTQPEWGLAINRLKSLLYKLRAAKCAVVLVSHTAMVEHAGVTKQQLSVFGKALPQEIPAAFDECWLTVVEGYGKEKKYLLQTGASATSMAKSRRQLEDRTDQNLGLVEIFKRVGWDLEKERGK